MRLYFLFLFICINLSIVGFSQSNFLFYNQNISPGSKEHLTIPIKDQEHQTQIPITIFHGAKDGPVLGITAGVHGYEYPPIMAGQALIEQIDPDKLKGTIVLVQVANVESFLERSPYVNPQDRKNLNRSFPGDPNGTITERIAHFISEEVIAKCDYFLDMHGGDAPEDLMPYIAYYQHDQFPEISEQGKAMAMHMGFDHVVVFKTTEKEYMKVEHPSTYCSAQAFKIGIPSVDVECGRLGLADDESIQLVVDGVHGLIQHLQMMEGPSIEPTNVITIKDRSYIGSSHSGFFYASKKSGDYVIEGMKLGYITDFFNRPLQEVYADKDGIILLILGTPPVKENETIAVIGAVE